MTKNNTDKYKVILSEAAINDLNVIHDFYLLSADAKIADKLIGQIENIFHSLQQNPQRGSVPIELRTIGLKHYRQLINNPFRVIYTVYEQKVLVSLILHQKQSIQKALGRRILM